MRFILLAGILIVSMNDCFLWGQYSGTESKDNNQIQSAYICLYPELDEGCKLLGNNPSFDSFLDFEAQPSRKRFSNGMSAHEGVIKAEQYITSSMEETLVRMFKLDIAPDVDVTTISDPKIIYVLEHYDEFMAPYFAKYIRKVIPKWENGEENLCSGLLYQAARYNASIIVKALLSYKVDPNNKEELSMDGDTPLAAAVRNRSIVMASMLLDAKADPNVMIDAHYQCIRPDKLLHYAADYNLIEIANLLIKAGACFDALDGNGATPLFRAVERERLEMVITLLDAGADVNIGNSSLIYPVHIAADKNRIDIMNLLIKAGANLNVQSEIFKETPLLIAMKECNYDIASLLLDQKGINVDHAEKYKYAALQYAISSDKTHWITEKLLSLGANPNVQADFGPIPSLSYAMSRKDNIQNVTSLLAQGANPHFQEKKNLYTALHYAVHTGSIEYVQLLLTYNVQTSVANYYGKTPLDIAKNYKDRYQGNNEVLAHNYDVIIKMLDEA